MSKREQMILKIFVDEHGPVGDCVLQKTQITIATEHPLHVPVVFKVDQDVLDYEFLVPTSGTKVVSKSAHSSNIACWTPAL